MGKIVIFCLLMFGTTTTNINIDTYALTIRTDGLENSKGTIVFALYNKDGSIPDPTFTKTYRKSKASIIDRKSEITFSNLPQGLYAVTVLHDENNNGELDKKFIVPLPDEGVGFSNYNDFGLTNRPNFENASFNIVKDLTIEVKIIYK